MAWSESNQITVLPFLLLADRADDTTRTLDYDTGTHAGSADNFPAVW
jgi:hypothetical protein